jgi:hypothetical protein
MNNKIQHPSTNFTFTIPREARVANSHKPLSAQHFAHNRKTYSATHCGRYFFSKIGAGLTKI